MIRKLMIAALTGLALCAGVWAAPPTGSPVAIHGALSVKDGQIVDKNDEPFQLRGMSLFWQQWNEGSTFYTAGTVDTLANTWKANVVRAAVSPTNTSSPPDGWKTVVNAAIDKGIYVVVDWHSHKKSEKSNAQAFFKKVSDEYKNTANVIYEIFNEPCPTTDHERGCDGDTWSDLKTYATDVVKTIRDNGDNNIIVIGTPDYSKRVDQASLDPVVGTNLAYAVHFYTATEPSGHHNGDLQTWCKAAIDRGYALLVTEFGVSGADGNGAIDTNRMNVWFGMLDEWQVGWMNWSITAKGESSAALSGGNGDGTGWTTTPSGTYIKNKLTFYANTSYSLAVSKSGEGTVTKWPDRASYTHGYPVKVTAAPAAGWTFVGWESSAIPASSKTAVSTSVSMKANTTAVAVFKSNDNIIPNGTFTINTNGWSKTGSASNNALDNFQLKAAHSGSAGAVTSASVVHTNIHLDKGATYRLSFKARGQSNRKISVRLGPGLQNKEFDLTTTMLTHTVDFTHTGSDGNNILYFDFGDATTVWFLDDVSLVKTGMSDDPCLGANPPSECATDPCVTSPGTTACCSQNAQHASCQTTDPCEGANPPDYCNPDPCAADPCGDGCPDANNPDVCNNNVAFRGAAARSATWSISRVGGGLTLRGPVESGSRVTLYDVRGKAVRTVLARDGMSIGQNLPAGNYFAVVRNAAGKEVFRSRVAMVR